MLIVGAGGLGSPSALYLAAAGVGTIGLIDGDKVDITNLQRQVLYNTADVGQSKAERARAHLLAINPGINVVAHNHELDATNVMALFKDYDLILDGTDRLPVRYLVNDACVILRKPLISAAIYRFEGQALTYVPGSNGPCYRCVFPSAGAGVVPNCAEAGVLGVLPGMLGTIQATEAIKLITGLGTVLNGRLLVVDALSMRFEELTLKRRADCAVCGDTPSITVPRLDDGALCSSEAKARIGSISARELKELLTRGSPLRLIDVRETHEFAAGHLPGAVNLPLSNSRESLRSLQDAKDRDTIMICRSGGRSQQACELAASGQVSTPINLTGGLLAWVRDVDPDFKVAAP